MPFCARNRHHFIAFPPPNRFPRNFSCFEDDESHQSNAWNHKGRVEESNKMYTLQMDIPGVKAERVTIEEQDGNIEITAVRASADGQHVTKIYQEIFHVNPYKFDISQAKAILTNGVLSLTVPKNENRKNSVEVETEDIPTDLPSNIFRFSMDLPGVSANGLKVVLQSNDKVLVTGPRVIHHKRILVERCFDVPPSMDPNQARALLQDGVFTFLAPVFGEHKNALPRFIYLEQQDDTTVESAVAQLNLEDNQETMIQDQQDVFVETVEANNDHESWEEVDEK